MVEEILQAIANFRQNTLTNPRLHISKTGYEKLMTSFLDITTPFGTVPMAPPSRETIFGIPIIISEFVPQNKAVMMSANCQHCGSYIGILDTCPRCGAPVSCFNGSKIVMIEFANT